MPRIALEQFLPQQYDYGLFVEMIRNIEDSINRAFEGRIVQRYSAASAPSGTTVSYQVGDIVYNTTPTETGTAGSQYLLVGWMCVAAGAPGVWRELRCLTGN